MQPIRALLLRVPRVEPIEFAVEREPDGRKDVDHCRRDDIEAVVVGYPYRSSPPAWVDARGAIDAYLFRGADFVEDLDGSFAIVIVDHQKGSALVATDRGGSYPVFKAYDGDTLLFSDSIEPLCRQLPAVSLDRQALLQFLAFSFMLGDRTHFHEIKTVRPATVLEFAPGGHATETRYWNLADHYSGQRLDNRDTLHRFNTAVRTAFELGETALLPLSGGLDSRAILSAAMPFKEKIRTYTFGPAGFRDLKVARIINRRTGIEGSTRLIDEHMLESMPRNAERLMRWSSGMVNFIVWSHLPEIYASECPGAGTHMYGIGGEMMRCFCALDGLENLRTNADIAPGVEFRFRFGDSGDMLKDTVADNLQPLRSTIMSLLDATGAGDPLLASECLYLEARVAKAITFSMFPAGRFTRVLNPFLQAPVLESVPRVSPLMKYHSRLHRYIIDENSPLLASVILDTGKLATLRLPRPGTLAYYTYYRSQNVGRRLVNRAWKAMKGDPLLFQGPYDYGALTARHQRQFVLETLDPDNMVLGDLIDADKLRVLVRRTLAGSNAVFGSASNLMCAELWLKSVGRLTHLRV
jgi:hypothetical protein